MYQLDSFMKLLKSEVDISTAIGPTDELHPTDTVLGTMSDDSKKMYVLREQLGAQLEELVNKARERVAAGELDPNDPVISNQITLLHQKLEIVTSLVWHFVQQDFGDCKASVSSDGLGLRKNWKVVAFTRPPMDLSDAIALVFGPGSRG